MNTNNAKNIIDKYANKNYDEFVKFYATLPCVNGYSGLNFQQMSSMSNSKNFKKAISSINFDKQLYQKKLYDTKERLKQKLEQKKN